MNQHDITLFMATIGLRRFSSRGLAQLVWGSKCANSELGIADEPIGRSSGEQHRHGGVEVRRHPLIAARWWQLLAPCSTRPRSVALRAVADDHQAALTVGIPLQSRIWAIVVWAVAGFVALVAGLLWGARNGVQFALTFVALKALPVLILGGFTSVPGAIVGGLIIGASESSAEVTSGRWWAAASRLVPLRARSLFLLVRPEGLFGEKIIRASDVSVSSSFVLRQRLYRKMIYREAGQFKTSYIRDSADFPDRQDRYAVAGNAAGGVRGGAISPRRMRFRRS